jgi:hypothetical protein
VHQGEAWRGIVFIDQWGRVWEWKKGDPEPVCTSEPDAPYSQVDLTRSYCTTLRKTIMKQAI